MPILRSHLAKKASPLGLVHLPLEMHNVVEGMHFFHAACSSGKSTCTYGTTSTETPDAYQRRAEKYKIVGSGL